MDPYRAISDQILTYAARIDLGDFEGVADVLADATVTAEGMPEEWQGRDVILALYAEGTRRYPETGTPRTKHVTTNIIIEVDEGETTASARSYFTVFQAVPGSLALQPIIAGRYADRFELRESGWRFVRRHMTVDLVGDLSQHLLQDFNM
jgi:SnoaL-like domain